MRAIEVWSAVEMVLDVTRNARSRRCPIVAISGIDGSGKGFVGALMEQALMSRGLGVATIHVDGWLNLPQHRFDPSNPAEHFYLHAIRLDEMFLELIEPLCGSRSVHVVADFVEETALDYRKEIYDFQNVDLVLLEGIYLLKRAYQSRYDLSFWVDCTFQTALQRAINRAQEGLSREETVRAYETIYFPAQKLHFERDNPKAAASAIIVNDPRLGVH